LCTAHSRIMPHPCILPLDIKAYYLPTKISPPCPLVILAHAAA
jgi:hypothetical protein